MNPGFSPFTNIFSSTFRLSELGLSTSAEEGLRRKPVETTELAVDVLASEAVEVAADRLRLLAGLGKPVERRPAAAFVGVLMLLNDQRREEHKRQGLHLSTFGDFLSWLQFG